MNFVLFTNFYRFALQKKVSTIEWSEKRRAVRLSLLQNLKNKRSHKFNILFHYLFKKRELLNSIYRRKDWARAIAATPYSRTWRPCRRAAGPPGRCTSFSGRCRGCPARPGGKWTAVRRSPSSLCRRRKLARKTPIEAYTKDTHKIHIEQKLHSDFSSGKTRNGTLIFPYLHRVSTNLS